MPPVENFPPFNQIPLTRRDRSGKAAIIRWGEIVRRGGLQATEQAPDLRHLWQMPPIFR
jgi:hypothetical protein